MSSSTVSAVTQPSHGLFTITNVEKNKVLTCEEDSSKALHNYLIDNEGAERSFKHKSQELKYPDRLAIFCIDVLSFSANALKGNAIEALVTISDREPQQTFLQGRKDLTLLFQKIDRASIHRDNTAQWIIGQSDPTSDLYYILQKVSNQELALTASDIPVNPISGASKISLSPLNLSDHTITENEHAQMWQIKGNSRDGYSIINPKLGVALVTATEFAKCGAIGKKLRNAVWLKQEAPDTYAYLDEKRTYFLTKQYNVVKTLKYDPASKTLTDVTDPEAKIYGRWNIEGFGLKQNFPLQLIQRQLLNSQDNVSIENSALLTVENQQENEAQAREIQELKQKIKQLTNTALQAERTEEESDDSSQRSTKRQRTS